MFANSGVMATARPSRVTTRAARPTARPSPRSRRRCRGSASRRCEAGVLVHRAGAHRPARDPVEEDTEERGDEGPAEDDVAPGDALPAAAASPRLRRLRELRDAGAGAGEPKGSRWPATGANAGGGAPGAMAERGSGESGVRRAALAAEPGARFQDRAATGAHVGLRLRWRHRRHGRGHGRRDAGGSQRHFRSAGGAEVRSGDEFSPAHGTGRRCRRRRRLGARPTGGTEVGAWLQRRTAGRAWQSRLLVRATLGQNAPSYACPHAVQGIATWHLTSRLSSAATAVNLLCRRAVAEWRMALFPAAIRRMFSVSISRHPPARTHRRQAMVTTHAGATGRRAKVMLRAAGSQ
jgi:hypothetical protein